MQANTRFETQMLNELDDISPKQSDVIFLAVRLSTFIWRINTIILKGVLQDWRERRLKNRVTARSEHAGDLSQGFVQQIHVFEQVICNHDVKRLCRIRQCNYIQFRYVS